MKPIQYFLFSFLSLLGLATQAQLTSPNTATANRLVLDLTGAQAYAEQNLSTVRNANADINIQLSKADETRARNLPKVTASADIRNNFQLATILFPLPSSAGGAGNGELTPVQTGTRWNFTAAAEVTQNILDLSNKGDRAINTAQLRYAEIQKEVTVQNLKLAVAKAYYAVLLNKEKLKLATDDKLRKSVLHTDAQNKVAQGQGMATDTLKSGLNLKNAYLLQLQSSDALALSLRYLGQQIGAPEQTEIVVSETLDSKRNLVARPRSLTEDTATFRAKPEYRAEQQQIMIAEAQRRKISYQYLPTINAYGYYAGQAFRQDLDFLDTRRSFYPVGYLGIKANWTIFDGFQKKAQNRQQLLSQAKSEATMLSLRQSIAYDRANALNAQTNAARNMTYQQQNLRLATTLYDQARLRVRQGQALQQEVTDAEYTLRQTEQLYLQSVYDYLVAELDYKKATSF
jgi:outer membrane protein TolC